MFPLLARGGNDSRSDNDEEPGIVVTCRDGDFVPGTNNRHDVFRRV
jgi:hypothetical protein